MTEPRVETTRYTVTDIPENAPPGAAPPRRPAPRKGLTMPAPIRVWRRGSPAVQPSRFAAALGLRPWLWICHVPGCVGRVGLRVFGETDTHAEAIAAGLAHFAKHHALAWVVPDARRTPVHLDRWAPPPCA